MKIEEGKFYFIKDEFFNRIDEKLLCLNKKLVFPDIIKIRELLEKEDVK